MCTARLPCVPQGYHVYRKVTMCTVRLLCVPQGYYVYRKVSRTNVLILLLHMPIRTNS